MVRVAQLRRRLEWVVAIASILGGLYIVFFALFPMPVSLESTVGKVLSPIPLYIYAGAFTASGGSLMYGLVKSKAIWRKWGLASNAFLRMYSVFLTILVHGFIPLTWLPSATLAVVIIVMWMEYGKRGGKCVS